MPGPPGPLVDLLGFMAALLTTTAFAPQVVKTWRSRSTGDFSLAMLTAFTSGVLLWLAYGLAVGSWPLVLANAITLLLAAVLLILKLRSCVDGFDRQRH